jgi:serine phosphatase RsbU (regulator of sigma subunit)
VIYSYGFILFNYILGTAILSIGFLHFKNVNKKYTDEVKLLLANSQEKNEEILQQKEEIQTQRDSLMALNKEIENQKNNILINNAKLFTQNEELSNAKSKIEEQNEALEKQATEIEDSLFYARQIQSAIFPATESIKSLFSDFFIFFKPRDIVSGDFYWINEINQYKLIAAADCTGHGVPGAFMSMLGITMLNDIAKRKEILAAADILNILREEIIETLKQKGSFNDTKDGIDLGLCVIDTEMEILQFAGANRPLFYFRQKGDDLVFKEYTGDRMPISYHIKMHAFTNHNIAIKKGDLFYLFSDGYTDQLGGEKRKKFMRKNFKDLIINISGKSMSDQKEILIKSFEYWIGAEEETAYSQIDDVLVVGVKY